MIHDVTAKMTEKEVEHFTEVLRKLEAQRERRKLLYNAKKVGKVLPTLHKAVGVYEHTLAHRILHVLDAEGPQTSKSLGASTHFAGMAASAAIVRLLDLDYIDRDSVGTYKITDAGRAALSGLPTLKE